MALENWIDDVVDVFAGITAHTGKPLRAYYVFKRREFPDAIADFPCALTFVQSAAPTISAGLCLEMWQGITEIHLFPDISRVHFPECMLYYARIRNAFAAHMQLGGKVDICSLRWDVLDPIRGPVRLQYGSEDPHLGMVVQWVVKENVSSEVIPLIAA
jgi:hypothetical protein